MSEFFFCICLHLPFHCVASTWHFFYINLVHTELLYVYEADLSNELRKSLDILWEHIRTSLKRFDYYFGHFTEQQVIVVRNISDKIFIHFYLQIIECCTFAKVRQYTFDSVVCDENERNTSFFLLSGQCSILQYLKMKVCVQHIKSLN